MEMPVRLADPHSGVRKQASAPITGMLLQVIGRLDRDAPHSYFQGRVLPTMLCKLQLDSFQVVGVRNIDSTKSA